MTRSSALDPYHRKRDFRKTPEPKGRVGPGRRPRTGATDKRKSQARKGRYVIQKHAARRLHFDFRLELDGVLKSWAITRGPSLDPADKRLAVRTEDHPIEYGRFEGVIPKGEYGGGAVLLWDHGVWIPKSDPHEGLERGVLKFTLDGERLCGGFTLVRMKNRRPGGNRSARENWLLIKERDAAAGQRDPVAQWTRSVTTHRTLDAIARDAATRNGSPRSGRAAGKRSGGLPLPAFVPPQLATLRTAPPAGDDWLHEIKHDGYRIIAAIGGGRMRLYTRSGQDWTAKFPGLTRSLAALDVGSALIDGEVVVFDARGRSDFSALQHAIKHRTAEFVLMAFDLLEQDGRDLRKRPLIERKAALAALLAGSETAVVYSDHEIGSGPAVLTQACRMGLEGIVSKQADAPYLSRRSRSWLKSKCTGRDEFVIGGYRPSQARGRPFSSLLVGEYAGQALLYRGRVGTGFDADKLDALAARLRPLARKRSPFADATATASRDACWVSPKLVAEIAYTERTRDGLLRHPSFVGLRDDKAPQDVQTPPVYRPKSVE